MDNKEKYKEEIEYCIDMIERVNKAHVPLNDHHIEAMKYYEANELDLGEKKKGLSTTVIPTLSDAINWSMPLMMEIFAANDESYYIRPRGGEDTRKAEKLSVLVDYQTRVKNNWFLFCHDWIQDAKLSRIGFAKYQWYKDVQTIEKFYPKLTTEELYAKVNGPDVEVVEHTEREIQPATFDPVLGVEVTPAVKEHDVKLKYTIEDEYPLIEAISRENIGVLSDIQNIKDAEFICHKVSYSKGKFIKTFSQKVFDKVKQFKDDIKTSLDTSGVEEKRFENVGGVSFAYDEKNEKYIVYECYYDNIKTGEPWITKFIGCVVLKSEKNEYDYPPFEAISVFRQAHKLIGYSFHDLLKKFQELSTALMRNLLNNIYMNNQGRYLVDASGRVNLDDFKNNNVPGGYIRVTRGSLADAVQPMIPPQLQPWAFELYERVERIIEYRSGIPRAYKGVDVGTLNKTFRGQSQQIYQASQIIKMMARLIGEMGFVPLIKDIIRLNQKFLQKKTIVRLLNEDVEITPEDVIQQPDVVINIGIGTNNKDMVVMQMQQLLGIFKMIAQAKIPVVTAQNVYHALGELIKAMGFKNKSDFITDPKFVVAVQELVMGLMKYAPMLEGLDVPVPPEITEALQKVMLNLGMGASDKKSTDKNMPKNIERPADPINPMNRANQMNPTITGDGNGHFG